MLDCSQVVVEFSGVGPFHHACVVKIINKIIVKSAPRRSNIILKVLQDFFFYVAVFGFFLFDLLRLFHCIYIFFVARNSECKIRRSEEVIA